MKLNEIRNRPGSTHRRKELGRGIGSGLGKTSGRGVKGQKARTGVAVKGFEGGQMPLFRRLPKRGFTSIGRKKFVPVNVGRLQAAVEAGRIDAKETVTIDVLVKAGIVRHAHDGMRLLADGDLNTKLTIEAQHASKAALAAVEKAGGSVKIIAKPESERSKAQAAKTAAKKKGKGAKPGAAQASA
jgi:large subunit ribosomal protein L15